MPYKDKEKQRAAEMRSKSNSREERKRMNQCRECGVDLKDSFSGKYYCANCRDISNNIKRAANKRAKIAVFNKYGGCLCSCSACPLNQSCDPIFLTIDHINEDGNKHLNKYNKRYSGRQLYRWLEKNNYPAGFQVLCWCCNSAKHINHGKCVHETEPYRYMG